MKRSQITLALALALGMALFSGLPTLADDTVPGEVLKEVRGKDVYVTASKVEQELLDVPMSVSVITRGCHDPLHPHLLQ